MRNTEGNSDLAARNKKVVANYETNVCKYETIAACIKLEYGKKLPKVQIIILIKSQ